MPRPRHGYSIIGRSMQSFGIHEGRNGPVVKLAISGELDLCTASALRGELSRLVAEHPLEIVIDLQDVTFADVSGLKPFIEACCRAGSTTTISVQHPKPLVRRVLRVAGFDQVLHIES